jgi:hypothetical protein
MNPRSYRLCATLIATFAVIPSLRPASCCNVEVVNGAYGRRVPGLASTFCTVAEATASTAAASAVASASLSTTTARVSSP